MAKSIIIDDDLHYKISNFSAKYRISIKDIVKESFLLYKNDPIEKAFRDEKIESIEQ